MKVILLNGSPNQNGSTAAMLKALKNNFAISEMVIATFSYWSMVYGLTPEATARDQEGQETIAKLGENFAWLVRKLGQ